MNPSTTSSRPPITRPRIPRSRSRRSAPGPGSARRPRWRACWRRPAPRGTRADGGNPFKRLHVVATPEWQGGDEDARKDAFSTYGANAAEIVASYIDEAASCSVAWGRTIDATVRHIRSRAKAPGPAKVFMPIAGEPANYEPRGVSPSDAARILASDWPN